MGLSTISWTDFTWNPFWGCKKVSEGCKYCYAEQIMERFDKKFKNVRTTGKFYLPDKIKNVDVGMEKVFTCSMSDFFIESMDDLRKELWLIIKRNPHLIFQILTKRIERVESCLPDDWGKGYDNVWLGVSIENERRYNEREIILGGIPAKVRFWSVEPLIERLWMKDKENMVDWIIVGGESGGSARKMELAWMD